MAADGSRECGKKSNILDHFSIHLKYLVALKGDFSDS
jgi:hypothetical protein